MSGTLFNIDDDIMNEFRKKHKGDMSKIVSELITNYIDIKKENLQLEKLRDELEGTRIKISKLKQDESNIKLLIQQLEDEYEKEKVKAQEVDYEIEKWAEDCVKDAKDNGTLTDLRYEAESKGFPSPKAYLIQQWIDKNGKRIED